MPTETHAQHEPLADDLLTADPSPEFVWGVPAIAKVINRNARQTYWLLENDRLPGCRKVGGKWCGAPDKLRSFLLGEVD